MAYVDYYIIVYQEKQYKLGYGPTNKNWPGIARTASILFKGTESGSKETNLDFCRLYMPNFCINMANNS